MGPTLPVVDRRWTGPHGTASGFAARPAYDKVNWTLTPTIISVAILLVAVKVALFICFDKKQGGWLGAAYDGHDEASRPEPHDRHAR